MFLSLNCFDVFFYFILTMTQTQDKNNRIIDPSLARGVTLMFARDEEHIDASTSFWS